jgi:hypothetical protein
MDRGGDEARVPAVTFVSYSPHYKQASSTRLTRTLACPVLMSATPPVLILIRWTMDPRGDSLMAL